MKDRKRQIEVLAALLHDSGKFACEEAKYAAAGYVDELAAVSSVPERREQAIISKLHEALAFMRSCELSGERGADHPVVIEALEATRELGREPDTTEAVPCEMPDCPNWTREPTNHPEHGGPICPSCVSVLSYELGRAEAAVPSEITDELRHAVAQARWNVLDGSDEQSAMVIPRDDWERIREAAG